jgi:hypothetical protein
MKLKVNRIKELLLFTALMGAVMATAYSCSKGNGTSAGGNDDDHEVNNADTSLPVIKIDRPLMNQVFVNGDTIKIEGGVTDNGLYRGKIKIVNDANGLLVKEQAYEIHSQQSYNFSVHHKTSVSVITDYTVSVEFEDHGLNITAQTVKVKVNP